MKVFKAVFLVAVCVWFAFSFEMNETTKPFPKVTSIEVEEMAVKTFEVGERSKDFTLKLDGVGAFDIVVINPVVFEEHIAKVEISKDKDAGFDTETFNITGLAEGSAYLYFETPDQQVKSEVIEIRVVSDGEDNKNRTVYVTPTGKKYHFSVKCAGENAIETTENEARVNFEPCKNCAQSTLEDDG